MQFAAKDFQLGAAVFAGSGVRDGATECLRHCLKSVADAEHRQLQVQQRRIESRSTVGVDTGRSPGQHQCQRIAGFDFIDRGGVRYDLRKNPRLPDPPGDQLGILRAEIDH